MPRTSSTSSIKLVEQHQWLAFLPWPQALLGHLYLERGETARAADALEQAFARACQLGDPCWEGRFRTRARPARRGIRRHRPGFRAARRTRGPDRGGCPTRTSGSTPTSSTPSARSAPPRPPRHPQLDREPPRARVAYGHARDDVGVVRSSRSSLSVQLGARRTASFTSRRPRCSDLVHVTALDSETWTASLLHARLGSRRRSTNSSPGHPIRATPPRGQQVRLELRAGHIAGRRTS